jgi:hypothetical protein
MAVAEEAEVPDAVKTVRQHMDQEAANELPATEGHDLWAAFLPVKVGDERRAVFRRPVSRRLFPNRTCAFRYASGSPEDMAKFGVLIQARRSPVRFGGNRAKRLCAICRTRAARFWSATFACRTWMASSCSGVSFPLLARRR